MSFPSLKNHFLVAMPRLNKSDFHHAVAFVCEHHEEGATGFVINDTAKILSSDLFKSLGIDAPALDDSNFPVFRGGPLQTHRGFVLHSNEKKWESTFPVSDSVFLTGSKDILEDIAHGKGPNFALLLLGYAGWKANQLEEEVAASDWLTVSADEKILFEVDVASRWSEAAAKLGVNVNLISSQTGHA